MLSSFQFGPQPTHCLSFIHSSIHSYPILSYPYNLRLRRLLLLRQQCCNCLYRGWPIQRLEIVIVFVYGGRRKLRHDGSVAVVIYHGGLLCCVAVSLSLSRALSLSLSLYIYVCMCVCACCSLEPQGSALVHCTLYRRKSFTPTSLRLYSTAASGRTFGSLSLSVANLHEQPSSSSSSSSSSPAPHSHTPQSYITSKMHRIVCKRA